MSPGSTGTGTRRTPRSSGFHGVGDDYIKTETDVFQEIVIYLARQKNRIWTDTFYEVASYIGDRQQDQVAK